LYRVILTKKASKGLEKAPDCIRRKAVEALDVLQESFDPVKLFDVKKKWIGRHLQNQVGRLEDCLRTEAQGKGRLCVRDSPTWRAYLSQAPFLADIISDEAPNP
jgi:mRNA-degrading endonuclease RelE of RelBE toxin-antitoxin system